MPSGSARWQRSIGRCVAQVYPNDALDLKSILVSPWEAKHLKYIIRPPSASGWPTLIGLWVAVLPTPFVDCLLPSNANVNPGFKNATDLDLARMYPESPTIRSIGQQFPPPLKSLGYQHIQSLL
jgi:hypothetical protein